MSLLKANSVQIGQSSTATNNFTLSVPASPDGTIKLARGNSGATTQDILSVNSSGLVTINNLNNQSFRNRIINGDMRIDQRNAGTSFAVPNASGYGSCDRWASVAGAVSVWTMQRVSSGNTSLPFALQVGRNSGSTSTSAIYVAQLIETVNCQGLAGLPVTFSFFGRAGSNFSSPSNGLGVEIWTGTGSDQGWASLNSGTWTGQAQTLFSIATLTTSYQRFTYTATMPPTTNEIAIRFSYAATGTAGANDWFQITGVQLEEGSTATDFERRPYGTELALCQRYYENNYPKEYPVGSNSGLNGWSSVSLNTSDFYDFGRVQFQVVKRASPTVNGYNPISGAATFYDLNTSAANGNIGIRYIFDKGFNFYATSVFTAGHVFFARYTADAEL